MLSGLKAASEQPLWRAAARISFCQVTSQPSSLRGSLKLGLPAGIAAALCQGHEACTCCLNCSAMRGMASW